MPLISPDAESGADGIRTLRRLGQWPAAVDNREGAMKYNDFLSLRCIAALPADPGGVNRWTRD
jgi:hypothetical protein